MLDSNSMYHGDEEFVQTNQIESNPLLLNIEDLCGEEWDVYTKKDGNCFLIQLSDENGVETHTKKLNEACMESLEHFCRMFILSFEHAKTK